MRYNISSRNSTKTFSGLMASPYKIWDSIFPCTCYECAGETYQYTENGTKLIKNNLKFHTFLEECKTCGNKKTEYKDLGRKGYYECWWCNHRTKTNSSKNKLQTQ